MLVKWSQMYYSFRLQNDFGDKYGVPPGLL